MHDAPTDGRTTLRILVAKGHLRIEQDGPRRLPTLPENRPALSCSTCCGRSSTSTGERAATLLDMRTGELSDDERRRLKRLIDKAAKTGR